MLLSIVATVCSWHADGTAGLTKGLHTPKAYLMPLPTADESEVVHSVGNLVKQAPSPDIWQHFKANLRGQVT